MLLAKHNSHRDEFLLVRYKAASTRFLFHTGGDRHTWPQMLGYLFLECFFVVLVWDIRRFVAKRAGHSYPTYL